MGQYDLLIVGDNAIRTSHGLSTLEKRVDSHVKMTALGRLFPILSKSLNAQPFRSMSDFVAYSGYL